MRHATLLLFLAACSGKTEGDGLDVDIDRPVDGSEDSARPE